MLERIAEDRLGFDCLCAGVEGRHPQFLERFAPPPGHKAPAHAHEIVLAIVRGHHIHRIGRAYVVAWSEIVRRRVYRQAIDRELVMTRGEVLRDAIAYALRRSRKVIRGLKEGLTEQERFAVADHTVAQLKERGDPWRLSDEQPTARPPST
jgi:hypothetical protein